MILLVDHYDSFVFNLARYFQRLGQDTRVVRNDTIRSADVRAMAPQALVLSPGPCTPNEAKGSLELVRDLHVRLPILGVCLGHQVIAEAFGGRVVRASEPVHGRASNVFHDGCDMFAGMPNPLRACRYHSLVVEEASLPVCLRVSARTADGVVMGLKHQRFPVVGVQFHPESILTDAGYALLAGFLRLARVSLADPLPTFDDERHEPVVEQPLPGVPVTF
ncbi:MAG TPA: aminodeoxychorismate/anthranilate synthase component II [Pirellulales bacterium]|nr:aminodeoxychorismate/anthranilate synthase component II [Pirellulales bacterium]